MVCIHCHVTELKGAFVNEDVMFHEYWHQELETSSASLPSSQRAALLPVPRCVHEALGSLSQMKFSLWV